MPLIKCLYKKLLLQQNFNHTKLFLQQISITQKHSKNKISISQKYNSTCIICNIILDIYILENFHQINTSIANSEPYIIKLQQCFTAIFLQLIKFLITKSYCYNKISITQSYSYNKFQSHKSIPKLKFLSHISAILHAITNTILDIHVLKNFDQINSSTANSKTYIIYNQTNQLCFTTIFWQLVQLERTYTKS
eukprot:TRINITY_DN359_c0_g1_i3.p1 TRINITY_DN359_c0_g1~~TRINITY_DN359_c0_g1_i3.p1  ORF type:complete len:193 (-),score=-23.69 TRINITY_DN359_c0_g1_i3:243-821(-)